LTIADGGIDAIKAAADRAMAAANPRGAIDHFQRGVALAPERLDLWLGLAACHRALRDPHAALAATEGALAAEPRCFPALLMKGSLLESLGQETHAATVYKTALMLAPAAETLAEPTRRAVAHAAEAYERYAAALAAEMKTEAGLADALATPEARRIETFIEAVAGRRKIYQQEPVRFHYPGLPAIEFHDRDEFPWLADVEALTADIRREVLAVWAEGSPELLPYVDFPAGVPIDQWAELNKSLDWSAFHLLLDGTPVEANCIRCPATMAALALIDQPRIQNRSPSAMFSILKAHTRIPPHTGVSNARLVLHLPLIVPEGCGFRVGGETRQWREGEAWVFDDTIEHEAWNDSDQPRAILICDVWSPRLSTLERAGISRALAALDRFNDSPGIGDGL